MGASSIVGTVFNVGTSSIVGTVLMWALVV